MAGSATANRGIPGGNQQLITQEHPCSDTRPAAPAACASVRTSCFITQREQLSTGIACGEALKAASAAHSRVTASAVSMMLDNTARRSGSNNSSKKHACGGRKSSHLAAARGHRHRLTFHGISIVQDTADTSSSAGRGNSNDMPPHRSILLRYVEVCEGRQACVRVSACMCYPLPCCMLLLHDCCRRSAAPVRQAQATAPATQRGIVTICAHEHNIPAEVQATGTPAAQAAAAPLTSIMSLPQSEESVPLSSNTHSTAAKGSQQLCTNTTALPHTFKPITKPALQPHDSDNPVTSWHNAFIKARGSIV